ncbi:GNAT family N-acetyltransferase [Actinotalea sp. AC32]|nr:GNAT family N-acetyltransferase [Actinotalea sp. AC32]
MSDWRITEVPVPDSLDEPGAWALHGCERVSRASDRFVYGHDDTAFSARYMLVKLREQEYARRLRLVATRADVAEPGADHVVGMVSVTMPLKGNEHSAWFGVVVHPDHRAGDVGDALLEAAERVALAAGRTTLVVESEHGGEPAPGADGVLEPPTGSGRILAADPAAHLAASHGYALEQAARYSVLELPVDPDHLARLRADAAEHAGHDYRLVSWQSRTPDEWVDALALLETRMSTDAPSGGLDMTEDPWDADRVRTYESDIVAAGHGYLLVAAEHVPSGELAAFTMVEWPLDEPEVVFQEDTLVLREHRGRRLGMLVKADLLQRLRDVRPEARRVHTWNAEENAFMLGINVALGFRPRGVAGEWQRKVAAGAAGVVERQAASV